MSSFVPASVAPAQPAVSPGGFPAFSIAPSGSSTRDALDWKTAPDPEANPDNLIQPRAFVKPRDGMIVIPAEHAPAGAPVQVIEYNDGNKKPGVVLGAQGRPIVLTFLTVLQSMKRNTPNGVVDCRVLSPVRFKEVKKDDGELVVRPYMFVPVVFDGCEAVYRLSVNGLIVHQFNAFAEAFEREVITPELARAPQAFPHLLGFECEVSLTRRCKAGQSYFMAPELKFKGFAAQQLPPDVRDRRLTQYHAIARPFLLEQDRLRREEYARRFADQAQPTFGNQGSQAA